MFTNLSRRRFLALSAAAAGTACFPLITRAQSGDRWGGFPIGVQSYSLRQFKLPDVLRHLQGMQVKYVEFAGTHCSPTASDDEIAQIVKMTHDAGLKISAHGVNRFTKDHDANKKVFDFAKKLGVRTITADPAPDSFDSLDKLVAEYDIRIAIHNHGPTHRYNKVDSVVKAIEGHDKRIGACVDCGHYLRSGEDPVKCVLTLGNRVYGVHMKDEAETNTPKSSNVVIGRGHLDLVALFKALRQVKFPADGALSLEYEANPQNPIDDMKACLAAAQEAIAKSVG
jgi:sugar phosphate isomerase/epimerase